MSQVQLFSHPDLGELKATIKNGEPWFLAGDVCRVLGIKNSSDAVNEIVKKLKTAGVKGVGTSDTLLETAGGKQQVTIINEQILYELIFNSRKQKAVLFRAWQQVKFCRPYASMVFIATKVKSFAGLKRMQSKNLLSMQKTTVVKTVSVITQSSLKPLMKF